MKCWIVCIALAASVGTAWGQTSASDMEAVICYTGICGPITAGGDPTLTPLHIGTHIDVTPKCPDGQRLVVKAEILTCEAAPSRTYTLDEIDRMRAAVRQILFPAADVIIEDQLRTYLQAGISPEALEAKATLSKRIHNRMPISNKFRRCSFTASIINTQVISRLPIHVTHRWQRIWRSVILHARHRAGVVEIADQLVSTRQLAAKEGRDLRRQCCLIRKKVRPHVVVSDSLHLPYSERRTTAFLHDHVATSGFLHGRGE